jgi:hypothetical protein
MKKIVAFSGIALVVFALLGFGMHKFYVGIFQINHAADKKMLQITMRIFPDDLNRALENKYKRPFHVGEKEETPDDAAKMQQYIAGNFAIKVNGKPCPIDFRSKEIQNAVLVCYYRITDISKIRSLSIRNKILFDYVTEQQNIIQTTVGGEKNSLLLTVDNPEGTLTF